MSLLDNVNKSRKNLKAYLNENSEFSQVTWSADGFCLLFKIQTEIGNFTVTANFIPYEDNLKITLNTGIICGNPYRQQMQMYFTFALNALEINSVYNMENGLVNSTYLFSFTSGAIEHDDYQKAFYHLKCSVDYCYKDIAQIACGSPIFTQDFVQKQIDDRMDNAMITDIKRIIAESQNPSEDDESSTDIW